MDNLSYSNWDTLLALCEGFTPAVDPKVIEPFVSPKYDGDINTLAALSPLSLPNFKPSLELTLSRLPSDQLNDLIKVLKILGQRPLAYFLTGSTKLITDMGPKERRKVFLSWKHSRFSQLNKLFRSLSTLSVLTYIRSNPEGYSAAGIPWAYPDYDTVDFTQFPRYSIVNLGEFSTVAEMETDVVIIGSGSGAGVVASRLSRQGHRVVILEKGKYYHQSELNFDEDQAHVNLYENGGIVGTEDGSLNILAGSTLGGGSTINWSASLKTPAGVRDQWSEHVPWYNESVYDEAMDYVMQKMGCSTEHIKHSFSNQMLMDGCKKLGYPVEEVAQNTGNQPHQCGLCHHGCTKGIKQGGVVNWLRDAVENGDTKILDQTAVTKIIHSNGIATGVEAVVKDKTKLIVRAKKVVVSAGSLHTPLVLQRSNFKNKNIGKGLKLHPVTVVYGEFPEQDMESHDFPILTSVSGQFANLDGRYHGPRLETMLQQPLGEALFFPWNSGEEMRQTLLKYNHLSAMLVMTRDRGSGRVFYTPDKPLMPRIDYTTSKFDCDAIHTGIMGTADLLYTQGVTRIIVPIPGVPVFESTKPGAERQLNDADFVKWKKHHLKPSAVKPLHTPFGSAHQMASCRMSRKGSSRSPLDDRGRLRECRNVFVADASVLPSASGANPMIGTMSSAHVIAGFVGEELDKEARTGGVARAKL